MQYERLASTEDIALDPEPEFVRNFDELANGSRLIRDRVILLHDKVRKTQMLNKVVRLGGMDSLPVGFIVDQIHFVARRLIPSIGYKQARALLKKEEREWFSTSAMRTSQVSTEESTRCSVIKIPYLKMEADLVEPCKMDLSGGFGRFVDFMFLKSGREFSMKVFVCPVRGRRWWKNGRCKTWGKRLVGIFDSGTEEGIHG